MRVITGKFRNLKLYTPDDYAIRPTSEKVKEAIFSSIQFRIENCYFLDIFSGTGQMGIEALSRGAKDVTFVDNNRRSISIIKKNLDLISGKCTQQGIHVKPYDALDFMESKNTYNKKKYDLIFMDPPYKNSFLEKLIESSYSIINNNGIVVCECSIEYDLPEHIGNMKKLRKYVYSRTQVNTFARE